MSVKTVVFPTSQSSILKDKLRDLGFSFSEVQHAFFQAKKDPISLTLYKSGKLVIQGKEVNDFYESSISEIAVEKHISKTKEGLKPRIGTDEAGKGDYFGPLVVSGVYVGRDVEEKLISLGVRDSKTLGDRAIKGMAKEIKKICLSDVVSISPKKYNELYSEIKNLNKLLAWAHGRVIENLLENTDCDLVVSDQFGEKRFLEERLMERGRQVEVVQRPRAEDDLAVAAASILSRESYLAERKKLSDKFGVKFPGSAGKSVVEVGRQFIKTHGEDHLFEVAKLHFKTTDQIL